jgi:hypothetical protein
MVAIVSAKSTAIPLDDDFEKLKRHVMRVSLNPTLNETIVNSLKAGSYDPKDKKKHNQEATGTEKMMASILTVEILEKMFPQ